MLGYTYPLLNIFWSMMLFFLFFLWIWVLVMVFMDIFRSHDIGGFAKALWFIFVLIIPLVGVLVYLIARGGKMHERAMRDAQAQDQAFRAYVKDAAGDGAATEVAKLADLRDRGVISEAEFQQGKAKALSG